MIINRRTRFTNLEYPNPFEDPQWDNFDTIPNKSAVSVCSAGENKYYKVPDGEAGWYALRVVPKPQPGSTITQATWAYTYLHEGSVVFLWCGNGTQDRIVRSTFGSCSLGADYSNVAQGGATGIICAFKWSNEIDANNFGVYSTAKPHKVADGPFTFTKWEITDGTRKIIRYTLGQTQDTTGAVYILIDGKPCLSFENPRTLFVSGPYTTVNIGTEEFDGIYLGTTPAEFDGAAFTISAGLISGQTGDAAGHGGGALGSSGDTNGPTMTFGVPPTNSSVGGVAYFDFTRNAFETNQRTTVVDTNSVPVGAYLYRTTEVGHDTTQPYAQLFTADAAVSAGTFTFYVNDVEYQFPEIWPNANKQEAFVPYEVYIQNIHIGDTLRVVVNYANGKVSGGVYVITMHSLVYGLHLTTPEFLWRAPGTYTVSLMRGTWTAKIHGAGGAGGTNGVPGDIGSAYIGHGGAGGTGELVTMTINVVEDTEATIFVGDAGLTYANGGNGGAGGAGGYGNSGGAGGGGGMPSYILFGPGTVSENYFGWSCDYNSSGIYVAETTTFYVNGIETITIDTTPGQYNTHTFTLTKGTTYNNGQHFVTVTGNGGINIWLEMSNGTAILKGNTVNMFSAPVIPRDISADFIGGCVYTRTDLPGAGSPIYNDEFEQIGTVATSTTTTLTYNGVIYSRYQIADKTRESNVYSNIYVANGGGGAGGGGGGQYGGTEYSRYATGGGGGGGGGYYRITTENNEFAVESVAGKSGGSGGGSSGQGGAGSAGNTQNFPLLTSGGGATGGDWTGTTVPGGARASGGGASGGGGGGGYPNSSYSTGGAGGGGAGGSEDASGGSGGSRAGSGSNYHTTPTASVDYLGNTVTEGWGVGGTPNMNGSAGWVYLVKEEQEE